MQKIATNKRIQAAQHTDGIKIPSIVKAELLYGALKSQQKYETVSFGSDESEEYGKLRTRLESEGKIMGPNDSIIASMVLAHDGRLITYNEREFNRIESLKVENWLGE